MRGNTACEIILYICPVLDCLSGETMLLCMDYNMKIDLEISALTTAVNIFQALKGAVIHSDRGSWYTSESLRKALGCYGVFQSLAESISAMITDG